MEIGGTEIESDKQRRERGEATIEGRWRGMN